MRFRDSLAVCGIVIAAGLGPATNPASAQSPKPPHVAVSATQANAIALRKYPGKVVGKTALENEEGKWQYGVMVQSGKKLREVMVNAKSGKIESVELTTAAKEAKEKAMESSPKKH